MGSFLGREGITGRACWLRRAGLYAVGATVLSAAAAFGPPDGVLPGGAWARPWHFAAAWLCCFGGVVYLDLLGERERLRRRTLRGTREVTPEAFNRAVRGEGLGVPYLAGGGKRYLRIAPGDEARHLLIAGDTGSGKSALMHDFLCQIARRPGQAVLAYDPALEFWECHARRDRGDVLLHPLYAGCPSWDLAEEIATPLDARALAVSFLPNKQEGREDFWDQAPRKILAFLLERLAARKEGVPDLLGWLRDPGFIDVMVAGTELSPLIAPEAAPQRAGVLASLNMIAEALKLLPPEGGPRFSFRRWAESGREGGRRPWVFVGSRFPERDALKPLVSAWLDTALCKLMLRPGGHATWVFADELPTLQRLPKLQGALQEARKYHVSFVLGFQGRAQLEALYGRLAETLMSAPDTRVFLKTKERAAAEWCAGNIGRPELERDTQSLTTSAGGGRDSLSTATERRADYLVLPNEIQNLPERTGYLRHGDYAVKFHFGYVEFAGRNVFRERHLWADHAPPAPTPATPLAEPRKLVLLQGGFRRG